MFICIQREHNTLRLSYKMQQIAEKINKFKKLVTDSTVIVEATTPTGLEIVAREEIRNYVKSKEEIFWSTGRIYFITDLKLLDKVLQLRCVDNVNIVADSVHLLFSGNEIEHPGELLDLASKINYCVPIKKWAYICNFTGNVTPTVEQYETAKQKQNQILKLTRENNKEEIDKESLKHEILKYRVTCERKGTHSFTSSDAERIVGSFICFKKRWVVDLKNWDLNVILRIIHHDTLVLFKITRQSLHRRKQLIVFGSMSLRPTIAYGMLAIAKLKPGDHVVDPLCGSGSIPIECMHAFPNVTISCGDISHRALDLSSANINAQKSMPSKPMLFKWCASRLPFQDHSVDAIVSDLPFGKRSGKKAENFQLYKNIIREFKRVLKYKTGRIVLLTKDSVHLLRAIDQDTNWSLTDNRKVNVGALMCTLVCGKLK